MKFLSILQISLNCFLDSRENFPFLFSWLKVQVRMLLLTDEIEHYLKTVGLRLSLPTLEHLLQELKSKKVVIMSTKEQKTYSAKILSLKQKVSISKKQKQSLEKQVSILKEKVTSLSKSLAEQLTKESFTPKSVIEACHDSSS